MFKFSPHERYMMPAHFGPTPQGEKSSGWYHDVTMMVVPYLTDREKLAAMLPHPVEVGEQPVVTVVYACSRDVDWLAGRGYNLIAVTASAVFKGENEHLEGQYSLVWWENLADAILSGRELTGIPKIFAEIPDHTVTDGLWQTNVSHFGNDILNMSINHLRVPTAEEMAAAQAAQEGKDHPMGWRYLPRVGGFGAAISQPTTFPSESVYTGAWIGEGSLEWNHLTWEQNPTQCHIVNALADLPILEYLPAMVTTGSTNLFVPERLPRVLDKKETLPANDAAEPASKTIEEIETVCFVGAGTMGCINALVAAISGYQVELYDISEEILKQVEQRFKEFGPFLVSAGYCTTAELMAAFPRISVGYDLEKAVANADLVSESVPENRELKREVHKKLDETCPAKTILTTNTSNMLVSEIEDAVNRGDRFAALHSYLASKLVDIVAGPRTTAETIDILNRYVESLKLVPMVLKKEYPGYVMNSLLQSILMTANALVVEGLATVEDVDRAYMIHLKAPMGPFGIMDMIGLDLIDSAMSQVQDTIWMVEPMKEKIAALFQTRVERGEFGSKSGQGFYTYPAPSYQQAEFLEETGKEAEIFQTIAIAFVRRAVTIALADVADPEEIDRTWMVGTGIDIGPFGILERMGADEFLDVSGKLHSQITLESVSDNEAVESYIKRI
jgi:3-hydroxyacyl-CoA dehydrogenase/acetoacetate decarboxylase